MFRKAGTFLLAIICLVAVVIWGGVALMGKQTEYLYARAQLETASLAHTAVRGQAGISMVLGLVLIAVLTGLGLGAYFYWRNWQEKRNRQARRRVAQSQPQWLPGPNAYWGQERQQPQVGISDLVQLEILRMLRDRQPQPPQQALILEEDEEPEPLTLPPNWH
jgi:hypothetical protein